MSRGRRTDMKVITFLVYKVAQTAEILYTEQDWKPIFFTMSTLIKYRTDVASHFSDD